MATHKFAIAIIPTYNEAENIERLLKAILALDNGLDILVIDDNSPDGTADKVKNLQYDYPNRLQLLIRVKKQGLGSAYLTGLSWALAYNYAYICTMDADFSHAPNELPALLDICIKDNIDMAIGSRYTRGSKVINWPRNRMLLSQAANWVARWLTNLPVQDITSGFVCYRHDLLSAILAQGIASTEYGFQVEIKFLAYQHGARLVEWPIHFTNRISGKSKMNVVTAYQSFVQLIQMKWHARTRSK